MRGDTEIRIDELILRVPGVAPDEVPALVDDVLRRVQDRLRGSQRSGSLQLAELAVYVPQGAGREELVTALATAIAEALR